MIDSAYVIDRKSERVCKIDTMSLKKREETP